LLRLRMMGIFVRDWEGFCRLAMMRWWVLWSTGYGKCAFMGFSEALEVWFVVLTGGESSRVQV
jgi:hypothetical protein